MFEIIDNYFKKSNYIILKKNDTQRTGFEPVRVTPSDFESDALTTRPSLPVTLSIFLILAYLITSMIMSFYATHSKKKVCSIRLFFKRY